ncbi:hypothetical protein TWF696_003534 [Orbilia brochopaga]|uniref:Pheromone-regulated membrane protein 10 n=1 Tax=Orbilia brochopaga TaxID=3140254 RepID=A0AAV9TVB8_9PEZI
MADNMVNATNTNSEQPGDDERTKEARSAQHVRFDLESQPDESEERTARGLQSDQSPCSPRSRGQQSDLEATATHAITQGPTPLLATDTPYIRKEQYDENATPLGMMVRDEDHESADATQVAGRPNRPQSGLETPSPEDFHNTLPAYKPGVLATLLKLAQDTGSELPTAFKRRSQSGRPAETPPSGSGAVTPKWYKPCHTGTAALLAGTSAQLADAYVGLSGGDNQPIRLAKPERAHPTGIANVLGRFGKTRGEDEIKLRFHIAHTLQKQKYLLQLCKALMLYGAPTHRLEEYLRMSASVLDVEGQFLYLPGCMLISFDDSSTHTSNMQLVRVASLLDLGKLQDVHLIYKQVVHDVISTEEGIRGIQALFDQGPRFALWLRVLVYGAASAAVGPLFSGLQWVTLPSSRFWGCCLSYVARLIDLPICFVLGTILGTLALVIAPKSTLYSNVFEIVACVIICFLARAFGSIKGGSLFCFSGIAQASIALILPGYIVLCGALELQSKNIVAGSVRLFFAIIYSLLLGFGLTVGAAIYGALDPNATSSKTCSSMMSDYHKFVFVLIFTLCLNILNQGKWKQLPVTLGISILGYTVNFFATRRFPTNVQLANALGAFAIGVCGNLYSRLAHQIAFTSIVPAIFIQVPSGLAAQGGFIAGLDSADSLTNKTVTTNIETLQNQLNSTMANVALGMIQVGIGISVGLFFAAIAVYPLGKRRSGLFTF